MTPIGPARAQASVAVELQLRNPTPRLHNRPRLNDFAYKGQYAYHVVLVTARRTSLLINDEIAECTRLLAEVSETTGFRLLAYCLMPDHLHVLVHGTDAASELLRFVQRFKQLTAYGFKQRTGLKLWQDSFFDRVIRREENLLEVATYIFANPLVAGFVENYESVVPECGGEYYARDLVSGAEASPLRESALRSMEVHSHD